MVGAATLIVTVHGLVHRLVITVPVFNIAPAPGEPLAFAFNALFFPVRLDTSVLSDGEYNARVTVPNLTPGGEAYMSSVTIWGDPAEHNAPGTDAAARNPAGSAYLEKGGHPQFSFGGAGVEKYDSGEFEEEAVLEKRVPLLTNPSQCSTPLTSTLETDSWEAIGVFGGGGRRWGPRRVVGSSRSSRVSRCCPDTLEAGEPAGYSLDLSVPQNTEAEGLATPNVKKTVVTLPLGTVISPSAADGLGDCSNLNSSLGRVQGKRRRRSRGNARGLRRSGRSA